MCKRLLLCAIAVIGLALIGGARGSSTTKTASRFLRRRYRVEWHDQTSGCASRPG